MIDYTKILQKMIDDNSSSSKKITNDELSAIKMSLALNVKTVKYFNDEQKKLEQMKDAEQKNIEDISKKIGYNSDNPEFISAAMNIIQRNTFEISKINGRLQEISNLLQELFYISTQKY